jgi:hypothetical protein
MIGYYHKFGNYFICENDETIAMCTQLERAKQIVAALSRQQGQCPHWGNGTDGCHVVLIDRCYHPDCEKWLKELRYGKLQPPDREKK